MFKKIFDKSSCAQTGAFVYCKNLPDLKSVYIWQNDLTFSFRFNFSKPDGSVYIRTVESLPNWQTLEHTGKIVCYASEVRGKSVDRIVLDITKNEINQENTICFSLYIDDLRVFRSTNEWVTFHALDKFMVIGP